MDSGKDQQREAQFLRQFAMHEAAIHAYIRRLVPRREDSLDVMQEAALVMWKKFDQLEEVEDFRRWAFGVAKFQVLSWRRDSARDRLVLSPEVLELMAGEADDEEESLAHQREAVLRHCLGKLDREQRAAVTAMYQSKSSAKELAPQFGRSVVAFYKWLHRIRQLLVDCAEKIEQQEDFAG